jgi:hypothetical protein
MEACERPFAMRSSVDVQEEKTMLVVFQCFLILRVV